MSVIVDKSMSRGSISDSLSLNKERVDHVEAVETNLNLEGDEIQPQKIDKQIRNYMEDEAVEIDEETNKRLRKMVHRRILPCMVVTYFMQALDKGTISSVSIMGIIEDANLVGQQYLWLTTCTYFAILAFEFPTNVLIQKIPVVKYLAFNIIAWGTVLAFHAMGLNFTILVVLRTMLGAFEVCCQPVFILMSSMWYKREEQALVVALWYMMNGGQQIVGGLLAYCFTLIQEATLKSWQYLFICYGAVTVAWGLFVLYWTPDSPMSAKCWSEEDKKLIVERVRGNQTGLQNRKFKKEQLYEAIRDPQTYCYFFIQMLTSLPTSGLGAFANIIIHSFGYTILETQLLAMVLGAYLIILLLSSSWLSKRFNQNIFFMIMYVVPSIIGTVVLMTVTFTEYEVGTYQYRLRTGVLLFCYYLTLSFWGVANLGLSLLSRNIAGQSKKSVCTAVNFTGWATGCLIGPQVFRDNEHPRYLTAFGVHLGCYGTLIILLLCMRLWLMNENRRKDKLIAEGKEKSDEALKHAFDDLTDVENVNFRYAY